MDAPGYLIHFYNRAAFLFQTVTMQPPEAQETALDALAEAQGWFWGRFAPSERAGYMAQRVAVETMLRSAFERRYWPLKQPYPVYLYLIPGLSPGQVEPVLRERRLLDGRGTRYLLFDLTQFPSSANLSFTVSDSLRALRVKLQEQGIPCRPLTSRFVELPDYGQVFPLSALAEVHQRNRHVPDLCYEIQVWDSQLLVDYLQAHEPETWAALQAAGCRL